jgi:chromosome condensin MukBEF MukE localization factor
MISIAPSEKLKEKIHACISSLQKLGMAVTSCDDSRLISYLIARGLLE